MPKADNAGPKRPRTLNRGVKPDCRKSTVDVAEPEPACDLKEGGKPRCKRSDAADDRPLRAIPDESKGDPSYARLLEENGEPVCVN